MKQHRTVWILLLCAALLLCACADSAKPEANAEQRIEAGIQTISKYGNIVLTVSPKTLAAYGIEPADVIRVEIGSASVLMPVGTAYSDVDSGSAICCMKTSSKGVDEVVLAINAGNLVSSMGIAEIERIDEEPGFRCVFAEGCSASMPVYLSLAEKQGYAEGYRLHQLGSARTNKREDYEALSDADYANFRAVETTGMGEGTLYRSSSPVDPTLNRSREADEQLQKALVRTVVNMADSEETMKAYPDYAGSNYAQCSVLALNMGMDIGSEDFRGKLAEGFRYMASHEGPYLIHCREGKDRTGFAAGVLECLMGASLDETVRDYMLTYRNFYGIEPGTEAYKTIAESNIEASLARAFGIEQKDLDTADLAALADAYLRNIGMHEDEIAALKTNLQKAYGGILAPDA